MEVWFEIPLKEWFDSKADPTVAKGLYFKGIRKEESLSTGSKTDYLDRREAGTLRRWKMKVFQI